MASTARSGVVGWLSQACSAAAAATCSGVAAGTAPPSSARLRLRLLAISERCAEVPLPALRMRKLRAQRCCLVQRPPQGRLLEQQVDILLVQLVQARKQRFRRPRQTDAGLVRSKLRVKRQPCGCRGPPPPRPCQWSDL